MEIKQCHCEDCLSQLSEEWRDMAVLYSAQSDPTRLIEALRDRGDSKALDLAYDCWLENPQRMSEFFILSIESLRGLSRAPTRGAPTLQFRIYHFSRPGGVLLI
ncbi:MAG: hypothetical protein AAGC54_16770 [Cyanobacteria bacterium P01_F01_bin.4]